MALARGNPISVLDLDGTTVLVALVSRLDETTTIYDNPVIGRSYDITPCGVRVLPDSADDLPHIPQVLVTDWESVARQLAAGDADHQYGWTRDGERPG